MENHPIPQIPWRLLPSFTQNSTIILNNQTRMGGAILQLLTPENGEIFVKIATGFERRELQGEKRNIETLNTHLPTPDILSFTEIDNFAIMVSRKVEGRPLHECIDQLGRLGMVTLLANVLKSLWSVKDKLSNNLPIGADEELADIKLLIQDGRINHDDFAERSGGISVNKAYRHITEATDTHDANCISHGDLCLPNILVTPQNNWVLIDWGKGGIGDKHRDLSALKGSLERNIDDRIFFEVLHDLGIDNKDISEEKINLYKLMDMFWYSAVLQ